MIGCHLARGGGSAVFWCSGRTIECFLLTLLWNTFANKLQYIYTVIKIKTAVPPDIL